MSGIDEAKVAGGKRKNGHKMDCGCHICKNMEAKAERHGYEEDLEKEKERKNGYQKKNGHKSTCACPICKNMKNKSVSKGGAKGGTKKSQSKGKKSNGHKATCTCPICKNMKKKGGSWNPFASKEASLENPPAENIDSVVKDNTGDLPKGGKGKTRRSNGHKPNCGSPICRAQRMKKKTQKRR